EVSPGRGDGAGAHVGADHFLRRHRTPADAAALKPDRLRLRNFAAEAWRVDVGEVVGDRRLPGHAAPHCGEAGIDDAVHDVAPGRRLNAGQFMLMTVWVSVEAPSIALALAWKLRCAAISI